MKNSLARDLREADQQRTNLLHDREQDLIANNNPGERRGGGRARMNIEQMKNRLHMLKEQLLMHEQEALKE